MKQKWLIGVGTLIVLAACTDVAPTTSPSISHSASTTPTPSSQVLVGCYGVWQGKNHYNVEILSLTGSHFTGFMTYDNYQFDSSHGSFDGTLANGVLMGVYRFIAEGMPNERELTFKQSGGALIQGFGDMRLVNGREIFVSPNSVFWDPEFTYTRESQCPD